jgi:hypothetical protein
LGSVNRRLRSPFARGDGDFPLLEAVRDAIMSWKPPGSIWRMSVELFDRRESPNKLLKEVFDGENERTQ